MKNKPADILGRITEEKSDFVRKSLAAVNSAFERFDTLGQLKPLVAKG